MNKIKIGNFIVGQKEEPLVIGEAGINHNGEIKKIQKIAKNYWVQNMQCYEKSLLRAEEL